MELEPITRQEKIIAGQDLTPITRMEKFLKEFGGGGAQPDWNAADGEPGHILNRPFGEDTEVLLEETYEHGSSPAKKLNGYAEVNVGDVVKATYDGVGYWLEAYEDAKGCAIGNKAIAQGGEDTGEPFAMYFINSASVCQIKVKSEGLKKTHTIKIEKIIVDTIEPKYLPNGGKGIGYEENKVLFDQRVEIPENENFIAYEALPISAGDSVKVTWDGVEYVCEAVAVSEGGTDSVVLGNVYGEGTFPFVAIVIPSQSVTMITRSQGGHGEHDVKIEKSVIHTIDPKFLPGGGGGGVVIVQDSAMASGVMPAVQAAPTATMNAAQIAEAVLSGKNVYFIEPNTQTLLPFVYGYRFGEMASGVMAAATAPDPFALFGSVDEEGRYIGVKVVLDGSYYTFDYGIKI